MAKQWKSGDKVKLVSGGPEMAVYGQYGSEFADETVVCQWFDKNGELKKAEFSPDSLIEVKKPSSA